MTFLIDTDPARLDRDTIHRFLAAESTWARGIPRATLERAIAGSLCFGGYLDGALVAFARVITDRATYANLVDVFVLPAHRAQGYAARLMEAILAHPDLQGLRRFQLASTTARGLYARYGFTAPKLPESLMERYDPGVYEREPPGQTP